MTSLPKAAAVFTYISILFFAVSAQTSESIYTLKKGTQIRVRMDNEINSGVSSVNDTFTTTVSAPVINRDVEVLPVGTIIEGRIVRVKRASFGGSDGRFEVKFETLYLPNGVKRKIDASLAGPPTKAKSSHTTNVATLAGGTAAGALLGALFDKGKGALIGAGVGFGIGAGALGLQKGEEARIKADEEFGIVLNGDVTLPPQDY